MESLNNNNLFPNNFGSHRIGILGGMGPMAGVFLQKLIIEATPAQKDQDHLQVLCFTNPHIKDRSHSLKNDGGNGYLTDIIESAKFLERAGVDIMVIPCNTAHARFSEIKSHLKVPLVNMVEVGLKAFIQDYGTEAPVGLLATHAAVNEKVYQNSASGRKIIWLLPSAADQKKVVEVIYAIKAGNEQSVIELLLSVANGLIQRGARGLILGCTELSMYFDFVSHNTECVVFDPLRAVAHYLVELSGKKVIPKKHFQENYFVKVS